MERATDILKRSRQRQAAKQIRRGIVVVITLGVVAGFSALVAHYHSFLLTEVVVSGNQTLSAAPDSAAAAHIIFQKYYYLWPKRSRWLYPRESLAAALANAFPRLSAVEVAADQQKLLLQVTEREGVALWCRGGECYFVDDVGYIFVRAPHFTGNPYLIISSPLAGEPIGQRPLPVGDFKKLLTAAENLPLIWRGVLRSEIEVVRADYQSAVDWYLTLRPLVMEGEAESFVVRLSLAPAIEETLGNAAAALTTPAFREEWQARAGRLDYFDLRFPPKVFYTFREP